MVAALDLQPHPEGGWYRELHRAAGSVQRRGDGAERAGVTLIAYLLQGGERSRWHRVRGSDEIWLHAAGAPLDLWSLPPQGGEPQRLGLGSLMLDTPVPWADRQPSGTRSGESEAGAIPDGQKSADCDSGAGADRPVRVIPADWWQAARSRGAWTLVHCVVGPGFAYEDFEILADRPAAQRPDGVLEDLL
ncbi:MAG: cupin domain-containing protein [Cyanobium sp.]